MVRNTVIGKGHGSGATEGVGSPRAISHGPPSLKLRRDLARAMGRKRHGSGSGFTFIEMVMVCTMIAILVAIAVPVYQSQVLASKEAVLKSNLATIRERLDQFKADRGVYPQTLDELVEKGYFRELPEDPMTGDSQWEEIYEDFDPDQPEEELGIYDVRSLSSATGTDGVPYSEW